MRFLIIFTLFIGAVLFLLPQVAYLLTALAGKLFSFRLAYRPFLIASAGLVFIALLLAAYGYQYGRFRYEVKEQSLTFSDLPASFNGYRIVHISDLHLDGMKGRQDFVAEIVDAVNDLHPDMICFTGDLVSFTHDELDDFIPLLSRLHAPDGVCSVLGNHDYAAYVPFESDSLRLAVVQKLIDKERGMGWQLLLNESKVIRRGSDSLAVVGVENQSCGVHSVIRRGKLLQAQEGLEDCFRILLTHDPSHWRAEVLPKSDIPLTLSGHTHAMQLRIGGFTPSKWVYPECDGLYEQDGRFLYVNIGIGGTFPCRIGATPEITLLELKRN